jgi:Common central domain of tyrosinase
MAKRRRGRSSAWVGLSRREVVAGAAGIAGAGALGFFGASPLFGQTPRIRCDIVTFAQDATRLSKFEMAVKQMQDASAANPADSKGWLFNANVHRDFCSIPNDDPNQLHFCWWFLAWHRAYISVTERRIRAISGDDTFSYPYWYWSSDRTIPPAFAKPGSPLAHAVRYPRSQPVGLTDGEVGYIQSDPTLKALGVAALGASSFQAGTPDEIPFSFGGDCTSQPI